MCAGISKPCQDGEDEQQTDWDLLRSTVTTAVAFLDNVIDRQAYPLPEVERMHKANRKVGLGVMGWADMLIRLGIGYATDAAVHLAEDVMSFITEEAVQTSVELRRSTALSRIGKDRRGTKIFRFATRP